MQTFELLLEGDKGTFWISAADQSCVERFIAAQSLKFQSLKRLEGLDDIEFAEGIDFDLTLTGVIIDIAPDILGEYFHRQDLDRIKKWCWNSPLLLVFDKTKV